MSLVWQVFSKVETDKSKVKCNECSKVLGRGGEDPRNQGTSNMRRHLITAHGRLWKQLNNAEHKRQAENRK